MLGVGTTPPVNAECGVCEVSGHRDSERSAHSAMLRYEAGSGDGGCRPEYQGPSRVHLQVREWRTVHLALRYRYSNAPRWIQGLRLHSGGEHKPSEPGNGFAAELARRGTWRLSHENGNVHAGFEPAGTTWRLLAWFLDFFVFGVLWFAVNTLVGLGLLGGVAAYLVVVAIPLTALRGQTVGQMAMGLTVVDMKGHSPPGPLRAAAHVLLSLLLAPFEAMWFVLMVWLRTPFMGRAEAGAAAIRAMPQRLLHDRLAGTAVVRLRWNENAWRRWARRDYPESQVAGAAARAATLAMAGGSSADEARVKGHIAAVEAGGEYRCRPDRTRPFLALWIVLDVFLGSLCLLGLANTGLSPAVVGTDAALITGPILATLATLLVARNSGFYLTRETVTRRNWLGRLVATSPRSEIIEVNVVADIWSWAEFTVVHPQRDPMRGLKETYSAPSSLDDTMRTNLSGSLVWWSDVRFREFRQVLGAAPHEPALNVSSPSRPHESASAVPNHKRSRLRRPDS